MKLQEKEWFAQRSPQIADAPNAAARKRMILALRTDDPLLHRHFLDALRQSDGRSHLLRNTRRYPLCGRGDINVYTVFAEAMRSILNERGRAGCVLPTGIATDDTTKHFFQDVVSTKSLASLFDFENRGIFFPDVHRNYKICLFTAGRGLRPTADEPSLSFSPTASRYCATRNAASPCHLTTSPSSTPTPVRAPSSDRAEMPSSPRPSIAVCRC